MLSGVGVMFLNHFGEHHTRGHKRHAEDDTEAQSGISTHFKKLRINHAPLQREYRDHERFPPPAPVDYMPIDETRDRIVIHDLDAEIAQIEAEERKTMFLPDIDKKVSAIPEKLLHDQGNNSQMQLVLYNVPSSISVPTEEDAVRKAIIAARARVRAQQAKEREKAVLHLDSDFNGPASLDDTMDKPEGMIDDIDAMDLG